MKRRYILAESVREIAYNNKEIFIVSYFVKNDKNDKEEVKKVLNQLWEVLLQAYNNDIKGVDNPQKLLKNSHLVRVCYYRGNIISCAFYSNRNGGNKLMYGGAIRGEMHDIGKQAFDALIERDVENIEEYNWIECSGKVEEAFKRHEAYMLPNKYVNQILNKNYPLCEDGFHYERAIGDEGEIFRKMIFGINSEDLLKQISMELFGRLYGDIKEIYKKLRSVQSLIEYKQFNVIDEKDRPAELQYAFVMGETIDEYCSYSNIHEIPEDIQSTLNEIKTIVINYANKGYKIAQDNIEWIEYIVDTLQLLKIICKKAIEIIDVKQKIA